MQFTQSDSLSTTLVQLSPAAGVAWGPDEPEGLFVGAVVDGGVVVDGVVVDGVVDGGVVDGGVVVVGEVVDDEVLVGAVAEEVDDADDDVDAGWDGAAAATPLSPVATLAIPPRVSATTTVTPARPARNVPTRPVRNSSLFFIPHPRSGCNL